MFSIVRTRSRFLSHFLADRILCKLGLILCDSQESIPSHMSVQLLSGFDVIRSESNKIDVIFKETRSHWLLQQLSVVGDCYNSIILLVAISTVYYGNFKKDQGLR